MGGDKAVGEMCRGSMAAVSQRQQTHNCHLSLTHEPLFLSQVITFTHLRMSKDREREGRRKARAERENELLKE